MFRWALSQDIVEADPTAGLTPYDRGAPRDRVLTLEEIELVWRWLESDALSIDAADILKLELLTGARCGEIAGLRAEEIDRQKWTWTLPAARSKNGRQRVTPIVGVAREIIELRVYGVEKGSLFLLEKGVVVLGPYRSLSLDAPDKAADRDVHVARSPTHIRDHVGGDGRGARSGCRDRGP
jgi:integrase